MIRRRAVFPEAQQYQAIVEERAEQRNPILLRQSYRWEYSISSVMGHSRLLRSFSFKTDSRQIGYRGQAAVGLVDEITGAIDRGHRALLPLCVAHASMRYGLISMSELDGCQVLFSGFSVQTVQVVNATRSCTQTRGDRQREAIMTAVTELIAENYGFADLSVSAISERAGVGRSGFYFYFDSKYSVLAQVVGDAFAELDELADHFVPRGADELPEQFAHRMVGSASEFFAHNSPLLKACHEARITDSTIAGLLDDLTDVIIEKILKIAQVEVKERGAQPISDDLPALVRSLVALTASTVSGDSSFVGRNSDPGRAIASVETLWRVSLLGR